jgi:3'(2'), 5'-bisphosphate nucleotidase
VVASGGELARELEVAERLARAAGAITLEYHGRKLQVDLKAGDEPVTVADRQASDAIVAGLREAFPDDVVISEEMTDDPRRLTATRVWYIDPIDGTKDFIRGGDGFCVMIGLAVDHVPRLGVLYSPLGARLFWAARGCGSWLCQPDTEPERLRCSDVADVGSARLVASKSHRSDSIDRVKSALGIRDEQNIGSVGLKLGLIAMGERELYVNPSSKSSSWDTCAPQAVLVEAGGRITDIHGDPLHYDSDGVSHTRGLLASNGHIHDAAVTKLAAIFPRPG